jgi:hypothetical protein
MIGTSGLNNQLPFNALWFEGKLVQNNIVTSPVIILEVTKQFSTLVDESPQIPSVAYIAPEVGEVLP